ncbi:unnamed protein product [Fasciola hepatica]|uniref:Uncharacterized protein n=1 Tax=Fasciola hepatica TaxID=6192 RepID=A0ABC9HI49_FASHE
MLTMECLTVLTACLTISALGQRTRDDFENLSTILQHLNRMLSIIKFGPIKRIGLFLRGKTPQAHTLEWFLRYFNMLSYHSK